MRQNLMNGTASHAFHVQSAHEALNPIAFYVPIFANALVVFSP